jgi:uncharacterized membrane protein YvlD (DUF360 family)
MADQFSTEKTQRFSLTHFIVRLITGAIVLAITAALTPGFTIAGLWPLLLGSLVLAGLDYLCSTFLKLDASPYGKGIVGFILAAAVIYVTQFFVAGYAVTFWGALLGALIYGIVDAVIPGRAM